MISVDVNEAPHKPIKNYKTLCAFHFFYVFASKLNEGTADGDVMSASWDSAWCSMHNLCCHLLPHYNITQRTQAV